MQLLQKYGKTQEANRNQLVNELLNSDYSVYLFQYWPHFEIPEF